MILSWTIRGATIGTLIIILLLLAMSVGAGSAGGQGSSILSAAPNFQAAPSSAPEGIFGKVVNLSAPLFGVTVITLESTNGLVRQIRATEVTTVRIPPRPSASMQDIAPGDNMAVMAEGGEVPSASFILVVPDEPVSYSHFTGTVIPNSDDRQAAILDAKGNLITADLLLQGPNPAAFQVVTALLRHDQRTGGLAVLGVDPAIESGLESPAGTTTRLVQAIREAVDSNAVANETNLKTRLRAAADGNLTALRAALTRFDRAIFEPSFEDAQETYEFLFNSLGMGSPTASISGQIELDIVQLPGTVLIRPAEGSPVRVNLTEDTQIRAFGVDSRPSALEPASQVEASFDPRSGDATRIEVVFPTLDPALASSLLPQIKVGELEGTVTEIDPRAIVPSITIASAEGRSINLLLTPSTRILGINNQPASADDLLPLKSVKIRFASSPTTPSLTALQIDVFEDRLGQEFVSGVVDRIIPKTGTRIPGADEDGNIAITTAPGLSLVLRITDATIVERNGVRLNIGPVKVGDLVREVKAGDLIRPTSRYDIESRELSKLALRSPELEGTVRGTYSTPEAGNHLTISTNQLAFVTVVVPETASVIDLGQPARFSDILLGQLIVGGDYRPLTLEATRVVLEGPVARRTSGTIASLDTDIFGVTIDERNEDQTVSILVPNKPGIITKDGDPMATFLDLQVGDRVTVAYYKSNQVALTLVVSSP